MAVKAKAHILPWVDNILSRMIFFFRYSSWVGPAPGPPPPPPQRLLPRVTEALALSCPPRPLPRLLAWPARQDETLKQSFLTAILMLVRAVSRNGEAQSYQFSQIPELSECLMVSARPGGQGGRGCPPPSDQLGSFLRSTAEGGLGLKPAQADPRLSHLEARPCPLSPRPSRVPELARCSPSHLPPPSHAPPPPHRERC